MCRGKGQRSSYRAGELFAFHRNSVKQFWCNEKYVSPGGGGGGGGSALLLSPRGTPAARFSLRQASTPWQPTLHSMCLKDCDTVNISVKGACFLPQVDRKD